MCRPSSSHAAAALQLPEQPSPSEVVLTSFPSINPLSAARLISLGCSLSELLTLSAEEQKQLAVKLSDIPANSLELFFHQAMWGQAITGLMPTAPGQRLQQNAPEYGQHHILRNGRQENQADELHTRSASHMQPDEYTEACQSTQLAAFPPWHHQNMLGNQARPLTSLPPSTHAPGVAHSGNPFQTFQYQPQHQSSSRSQDTKQLLQGYAHGDRQHGHLPASMQTGPDSGSFAIEEIPVDYTDDYVYDSLAPSAEYSHQHHQQRQQQQQHDVDWQSYLPEEEEAGDTVPASSMPWQHARHQPCFTDELCNHAGAADVSSMHSMDLDHMRAHAVPDVVIDDVSEGTLLLQYL